MSKYIIELDDDIVKGIRGKNDCKVEPREIVRSFQATIADAIANGIPYNPTGDCVSREALKAKMFDIPKPKEGATFWDGVDIVGNLIDNAPLVENAPPVESERTGKWIKIFENPFVNGYKCPFCGHRIQVTEQFLPQVTECEGCGADMRGDAKNE